MWTSVANDIIQIASPIRTTFTTDRNGAER